MDETEKYRKQLEEQVKNIGDKTEELEALRSEVEQLRDQMLKTMARLEELEGDKPGNSG